MKTKIKKKEKVVMVTNPHWFIMVGPFFLFLLGLIIKPQFGFHS